MRLLRTIVVLVIGMLLAREAAADEIAPELITEELRIETRREFDRLFATLDAKEKRRLAGTYVAFDSDPSDAFAMAACDDDGDHVVVVSHAMLRLVADVARLGAHGDEYAELLARSQLAGKRLVPPPPGSFDYAPSAASDELRREALAFVVGRELALLRAGALVCAHPTATKEHGDDEWTAAERRDAFAMSKRLYPANGRDETLGDSSPGARALLRFFAKLREAQPAAPPSYLVHHPRTTIDERP